MSGLELPPDNRGNRLVKAALDIIEICRASQGERMAYCRTLNSIIETGKQDGTKSLINLLYRVIDRLASHLFSPTSLVFTIDFENEYPKHIINQAKMAARVLTRDWERRNTDMMFSQGVFESLKYGSCIMKQWVQQEGRDMIPAYYDSLVMPWQFGVYNEGICDLSRQPAMVETSLITLPELWRRIYHLPDAKDLFERAKTHAGTGQGGDISSSFFHQVLSGSTLNTGVQSATRPIPGGIVQLNNDPNYSIVGPSVAAEMIKFHELWIQGETDYITVQIVEPDILIAPRFKRTNLLMGGIDSGLHPYTMIQANKTQGYIWGRPEIADLIEPQGLLSQWADDTRRLYGVQIDKVLGFTGDQISDEIYDASRMAGYFNLGQGGGVEDLTPKMPPEALQMLEFCIKTIEKLSGFDNILSGGGEPGVRAGNHANTLMRTASPQLRDRSLLIERQCASAADLRFSLMENKDARAYWTDPNDIEGTKFILNDIPDDRRVSVDSHSSSPIFADNHEQLVAFGLKAGFLDGEDAIEMLPFPQKDLLLQKYKERQKKQAELIKEHPELLHDMVKGKSRR